MYVYTRVYISITYLSRPVNIKVPRLSAKQRFGHLHLLGSVDLSMPDLPMIPLKPLILKLLLLKRLILKLLLLLPQASPSSSSKISLEIAGWVTSQLQTCRVWLLLVRTQRGPWELPVVSQAQSARLSISIN